MRTDGIVAVLDVVDVDVVALDVVDVVLVIVVLGSLDVAVVVETMIVDVVDAVPVAPGSAPVLQAVSTATATMNHGTNFMGRWYGVASRIRPSQREVYGLDSLIVFDAHIDGTCFLTLDQSLVGCHDLGEPIPERGPPGQQVGTVCDDGTAESSA